MDNFEINNVSIEKIYKSEKSKDGVPYISSKGNAYTKVDIYIDPRTIEDSDFKGKITYFDYYGNTTNWAQGTTISGTISKNGQYFNFQLPPSGKKALELDIKELVTRQDDHEKRLKALEARLLGKGSQEEKEEEEDDLPF